MAFLHGVKERKTPSLSAQASFAPFSLKVAWSGKSLILSLVAFLHFQDVARRCFCPPGEEALFPCTPYRTALCRPCPAGRYSTSHDHAPCTRCRPCPADRAEVTPCQATHPAVCVERETLRGACMGVRCKYSFTTTCHM